MELAYVRDGSLLEFDCYLRIVALLYDKAEALGVFMIAAFPSRTLPVTYGDGVHLDPLVAR